MHSWVAPCSFIGLLYGAKLNYTFPSFDTLRVFLQRLDVILANGQKHPFRPGSRHNCEQLKSWDLSPTWWLQRAPARDPKQQDVFCAEQREREGALSSRGPPQGIQIGIKIAHQPVLPPKVVKRHEIAIQKL